MLLDKDKKTFETMITNAAASMKILREYVEKDYWLTQVLKNILKNDKNYVFKGGTSLSKCYHLIQRFSEDIDISYKEEYKSLTVSQVEKKFSGIKEAIEEAGLTISNSENLRRRRYFNQFHCPYPSLFNGGNIVKAVIVELSAQTPSFPSEKKVIQSFVGEYLEKIDRHDLVELYELEPFEIETQCLERTLVDKTFAICDYYIDINCERHSRHLYDIYKLLTVIELNNSLIDLFKQVKSIRKRLRVCYSARDGVVLSNVLDEIIKQKSYKEDYEKITYTLLYEKIKYSECEKSLIKLRDFLKQNGY